MDCVRELSLRIPVARACNAVGLNRARWYRNRIAKTHQPRIQKPHVLRALAEHERANVLQTLDAPDFVDLAPAQAHAKLLDRGVYLCSVRTMYRILGANAQVRERRDILRHPNHPKPHLMTTEPNQLWSWDITKLHGPAPWTYFYLYVILDVFSRYVVGWMVAYRESAALAKRLISESCFKQGVSRNQLTLHADRGSSMTSKAVAQLLADLGVVKSHSRPHVSDDNAYSEAHFKTLKYRPDFPDRFGSLQDARGFCGPFFTWYNEVHYHSGIAMLTPASVHHGNAQAHLARRHTTTLTAHAAHPERFVHGAPTFPILPAAVWINQPITKEDKPVILHK